MKRWSALILCSVWLSASPVWAQPGLLVPAEDAVRMAEELTDARSLAAQVENLRAALAAKDEEIKKLQDSDRGREVALAIAEDRDKRREEAETRLLKALEISDRQLQRSNEMIEKALARIDKLETRQMWMMVLGPIGLGIAFLTGALR